MGKKEADKMRVIINKASLKVIVDLRANLSEACKAILGNSEYTYSDDPEGQWEEQRCLFCDSQINNHEQDCIVLKAKKWMEG
jgi:hypothetical protein